METNDALGWIFSMSSGVYGAIFMERSPDLARAFLSAYAIHFFLGDMVQVISESEVRLLSSARLVLEEFDSISRIMKDTKFFLNIPPLLAKTFSSDMIKYVTEFRSWESDSKLPFWSRARSALVEFYLSYFRHSKRSNDLLEEIYSKIQYLRERCIMFCGQDCIDVFDAELLGGKFGMPPLRTQDLPRLVRDQQFFLVKDILHLEVTFNALIDAGFRLSLEHNNESPIFANVDFLRKDSGSWNEIIIELSASPPSYNLIGVVLVDMKTRILRFSSESSADWIKEKIKPEYRPSKFQECVCDIRSVVEVLSKLQMPVRDGATAAEWGVLQRIETVHELMRAFAFAYRLLKMVEIDFDNMNLLLHGGNLQREAVTFFGNTYNMFLEKGLITMDRTKVVCCGYFIAVFTLRIFSSQEWISASLKTCWEKDSIVTKPLTSCSLQRVLYYGFRNIIFSEKFINNETDLPETLLFSVWRLCALQRKFRVDIAALCTLSQIQWMLVNLGLIDCRDQAMQCILRNFMSLECYGKRVGWHVCVVLFGWGRLTICECSSGD